MAFLNAHLMLASAVLDVPLHHNALPGVIVRITRPALSQHKLLDQALVPHTAHLGAHLSAHIHKDKVNTVICTYLRYVTNHL